LDAKNTPQGVIIASEFTPETVRGVSSLSHAWALRAGREAKALAPEPLARWRNSWARFPIVLLPLPLEGTGSGTDASTPLADHVAREFGQRRAEAFGCGSPTIGSNALPGRVTKPPAMPAAWPPIVSHTCVATMQRSAGATSKSCAT
jgi:hypothetical protein